MNNGGKVFIGILVISGLAGLIVLATRQKETPLPATHRGWQRVNLAEPSLSPDVLYENEKRIKLIRGQDGHIEELVIHHTIKQNALDKIPEGILEF